jgi:hypothetical protein
MPRDQFVTVRLTRDDAQYQMSAPSRSTRRDILSARRAMRPSETFGDEDTTHG